MNKIPEIIPMPGKGITCNDHLPMLDKTEKVEELKDPDWIALDPQTGTYKICRYNEGSEKKPWCYLRDSELGEKCIKDCCSYFPVHYKECTYQKTELNRT